jgi:hypothetical protein
VQITGESSMKVGTTGTLNTKLPAPGIVFGPNGFSVNATADGFVNLAGYTFKLDKSAITYKGNSLQLSASVSLNEDKEKLAFSEGTLVFTAGQFTSASGKIGGTIDVNGGTFELQNLAASLDIEKNAFAMNGSFKVRMATGQKDKTKDWFGASGSLMLAGGVISSVSATFQTGTWEVSPGFTLLLNSLTFSYKQEESQFRIFGNSQATILGSTIGFGISDPGLLWRNGSFVNFGGNLTGGWGPDFDGDGIRDFDLNISKLGFLIETGDAWRVTLTGGGTLVYNDWVMAGGGVTTDEKGIIFGANGLEHLGFRGSLVFGFGDQFDDKNRNFVWDEGEKYDDRNVDGKYTAGIGIVISNAGISYTPATETSSYRLKLTGMGRLAFEVGNLAEYPDLGVLVDLTKDGIEIIDGKIQTFSFVIGANFQIGGLDFLPVGKAGIRYKTDAEQWDLFGTLDATIGKKGYGFSFGKSFDSPGIRWVKGSVTQVSAGITGEANLGGVNVKFTNAGLAWNNVTETFAVFGSASVKMGATVTVGLGTMSSPGLLIGNNDWELNGLELGIKDLNITGYTVNQAKIGFSKNNDGYSA